MDFDTSFSKKESPAIKHNNFFSDELQGEFQKIRPQNFNEESEEASKVWLLNIKRYF